jgi:hypothetical protein
VGWRPSPSGAPAHFSSRGPRFEAEESGTTNYPDGASSNTTLRLAGRVSPVHASGTLRYAGRYRAVDGTPSRCESPVVRWSADSR